MAMGKEDDCVQPVNAGATQTGKVYILNHERSDSNIIQRVTQKLAAGGGADCRLTCLGLQGSSLESTEPVLTPAEYLLRVFRQFRLDANEREMLLSEEDQRIAVQLCLATRNKELTGEFDIEVSRVLEYNQRLERAKLSTSPTVTPSDDDAANHSTHLNCSFTGCDIGFSEFQELYAAFLKTNNILDVMDLIQRLQNESRINKDLQNSILGQSFLYLQPPQGLIQKSMFRLLARGKQVEWIKVAEPLESGDDVGLHVNLDQILIELTTQEQVLSTAYIAPSNPSSRASVTEAYVEKLMLGYVHLLVNSRSEIALARVINTPERELDHKAFTDLKHQAQTKAMSMFQTAVSYIMKIRLGGRSYAPDPNCPMAAHVKGLGDFTDLMHKLQTILEEVPDHRNAVRRVLALIKNTIIKCQDNVIRRQCLDNVKSALQAQADWVIDNMEEHKSDSPPRKASAGGSLVGRQAMRVLRWLLDHSSTQTCNVSALDSLTDIISSQRTPLRFPSIMSKFKSPVECSPEAKENLSLVQRLKDKYPVKKSHRTGAGSCLDWAKPLHDTGFSSENLPTAFTLEEECIPSNLTRVVDKPSDLSTSKSLAIRVLESINDQENTDSKLNPASTVNANLEKSVAEKCDKPKKPSTKRPLGDSAQNQPSKKAKLQSSQSSQVPSKPKTSKVSKKKVVPLQKGQKTLGAFFRL